MKISGVDISRALEAGGVEYHFEARDVVADGLEFDSRKINPGNIFVALKGEKDHGHQYLSAAFSKGASLAIVEDKAIYDSSENKAKLVLVRDSLSAMVALGRYLRLKLAIPVIGITGTIGKTTCKEMLSHVLGHFYAGGHSIKSYNNIWGIPHSICNLKEDARWFVQEMGMNHPGELSELTQIVKPTIATVLIITPVHMEFFKDLEAVAKAKCEIFEGLTADGSAILNADDEILRRIFVVRHPKLGPRTKYFGKGSEVDLRLMAVKSLGTDGLELVLSRARKEVTIKLPLVGKHNAAIAAAVALMALQAFPELTLEQLKPAFESFKAPYQRLAVKLISGRTVIDDSYNASPVAMKASLDILVEVGKGKRRGAVLGDMRELGESSESYHRQIGQYVAGLKLDFLIGVGPFSRFYLEEAQNGCQKCRHAKDPEEAAKFALEENFEVLLVKGSRGIELERTIKKLG